eukprot:183727-Rhodomonas_salina.2
MFLRTEHLPPHLAPLRATLSSAHPLHTLHPCCLDLAHMLAACQDPKTSNDIPWQYGNGQNDTRSLIAKTIRVGPQLSNLDAEVRLVVTQLKSVPDIA